MGGAPAHAASWNWDSSIGSFTYEPEPDFEGVVTFQYRIRDEEGWVEIHGWSPPYDYYYQEVESNVATVTIEVGKAVRTNLTIAGLDEEEEDQNYGELILLNDDDDNQNTIEDRNEVIGPIRSENDLTRVDIDYWLRDDVTEEDFKAQFVLASSLYGAVRLWTTADKEKEITPYLAGYPDYWGEDFLLADLPSEIYVEGLNHGTGYLGLQIAAPQTTLFSNTEEVSPFGGSAGTADQDNVNVTVGLGLTAYRPMHGPGTYDPFQKTPVKEGDEESPTLGPGIRINGDYDNGGTNRDLYFTGVVIPNENDLIEVRIDRQPGMGNLVLEISPDSPLLLYTTPTKDTPIPFSETTHRTDPLNFAGDTLTVYVEWYLMQHGTADLTLIDVGTNDTLDTLKFHSFQGITIVLGGLGQVPGVPTDPNHGMFLIADDLYEEGYDVYKFDEDEVGSSWGPGPGGEAGRTHTKPLRYQELARGSRYSSQPYGVAWRCFPCRFVASEG